jgi:hypothetical protein
VLFVAAVALLSLMGTASAEPDVLINPATAARVTVHPDVSIQALTCNAGDLCVWPVTDGSRNRCSWTNADNDWQSAPVTCSWSSSSAVWAVYNHGTSTSYAGVCLYANANYTNWQMWLARGVSVSGAPGVRIRSHRWVTGTTC